MPWIDEAECAGCGVCVDDCEPAAISMNDDGVAEIDQELCEDCGKCVEVCPTDAIKPGKPA